MQPKRVWMLLTILFIQLSVVSNANFWDGFHETKQSDQALTNFVSNNGTDGYGVDIVRLSFVYEGLFNEGYIWKMSN